jgi:hypothetical protein
VARATELLRMMQVDPSWQDSAMAAQLAIKRGTGELYKRAVEGWRHITFLLHTCHGLFPVVYMW